MLKLIAILFDIIVEKRLLSINFKGKQQALYNSLMLNSPGTGYDPSQEFGGNKD